MKKKILAVLVCAAVMLTTACGKSEVNSNPTGGSSNESSSKLPDSSTASSDDGSSSDSSSSSESEVSSPAPESSTPEADSKFAHGKQDGNTYTSKFLGIKAEFADGWTLMTEDVLAQYNGIDDMSDENVNKVLDTNAMSYELMAAKDTVTNVNIVIENLNLTNGGKSISAEDYIDAVLPNLEAQFKAAAENVEVKKSTASFLGSEVACINTKLTVEGVDKAQCVIPISKGAYIANITFTGVSEAEVTSVMNRFKSM